MKEDKVKVKEVIELLKDYTDQEWKAKIWFNGKFYAVHAIVPETNHPEYEFAIIWSGNVGEEMLEDAYDERA
jgi:hypothetical protein